MGHDEPVLLIDDPDYTGIAADLRTRLARWMAATGDPLLDGPVPAPPGARINSPDQLSANAPTFTVES